MRPVLEVFPVMPFAENSYLFGDAEAGEAIAIDPGGRAEEILAAARRHGLAIRRIVNTHAHVDHVSGVGALQSLTGASFWLHPAAEAMLATSAVQAAQFGLPPFEAPRVDGYLAQDDEIAVGGIRFVVREAFGHAPGHVILRGPELALTDPPAPIAFVGDLIFAGGIGRTDLVGGDFPTLMQAIEREVLSLPDATLLFSGHGPATTVGRERRGNPWVLDWMGRTGGGA